MGGVLAVVIIAKEAGLVNINKPAHMTSKGRRMLILSSSLLWLQMLRMDLRSIVCSMIADCIFLM